MSPAKKKKAKKRKTARPPPPAKVAVVVPLMPSPGIEPPAQQPKKGIWYLIRGTTIGGVFLIALGTAGFLAYLRTDKDHPPETALLWASVIMLAAGFHFVSRQSVKNFLVDVGRFLPWGKKDSETAEQPAAPPAGGGGV